MRMKTISRRKPARAIDAVDAGILEALLRLREEMDIIHSNLDSVTDPVLIDSYIFELKAVHARYQYYSRECKQRGIALIAV